MDNNADNQDPVLVLACEGDVCVVDQSKLPIVKAILSVISIYEAQGRSSFLIAYIQGLPQPIRRIVRRYYREVILQPHLPVGSVRANEQ